MADSIVVPLSLLSFFLTPWAFSKFMRLIRRQPTESQCWAKLGFSPASPVVVKALQLAPKRARKRDAVFCILTALWIYMVCVGATTVSGPPFDPYEVLQISGSSTNSEIRSAYRRRARTLHPDKNPDPAAAVRLPSLLHLR